MNHHILLLFVMVNYYLVPELSCSQHTIVLTYPYTTSSRPTTTTTVSQTISQNLNDTYMDESASVVLFKSTFANAKTLNYKNHQKSSFLLDNMLNMARFQDTSSGNVSNTTVNTTLTMKLNLTKAVTIVSTPITTQLTRLTNSSTQILNSTQEYSTFHPIRTSTTTTLSPNITKLSITEAITLNKTNKTTTISTTTSTSTIITTITTTKTSTTTKPTATIITTTTTTTTTTITTTPTKAIISIPLVTPRTTNTKISRTTRTSTRSTTTTTNKTTVSIQKVLNLPQKSISTNPDNCIINLNSTANIFNLFNSQNYTIFNITNMDSNTFWNIDNKAKGIIILSSAIASMLMSTCFLFFIIWFCCSVLIKEKRHIARSKKMRTSLLETESNLNKIGIRTFSVKPEPSSEPIKVRDDDSKNLTSVKIVSEVDTNNKKKTKKKSSPTVNRSKKISNIDEVNTPRQNQNFPKTSDQTFHPYDSLHLRAESIPNKNKKHNKDQHPKSYNCNYNQAFMNDYEYFTNEISQGAAANKSTNQRYENLVVNTTNKNNNTNNSSSGRKSIRNMPQLSKEQIEQEFYAYDLECKRHYGKFSSSNTDNNSSSTTPPDSSTTDSSEVKQQQQQQHQQQQVAKNSVKRQSVNSIKAKKMAKQGGGGGGSMKSSRDLVWQI